MGTIAVVSFFILIGILLLILLQFCLCDAFSLNNNVSSKKSEQTNNNNIRILLETDELLVIDKPPGIQHHNDGNTIGILNLLRQQLSLNHSTNNNNKNNNTNNSNYNDNNNNNTRLYGVHRLDRVTSGILVFAKHSEIASNITKEFRQGNVIKYYIGLSYNKPKIKKQGWVKGNMIRGRRKSWYLTTTTNKNNNNDKDKYAITRFYTAGLGHLLLSSTNNKKKKNLDGDSNKERIILRTLILFRPYTGKTHQLRVAAKSMGIPIANDPIYDNTITVGTSTINEQQQHHQRTYLHAIGLHIPNILTVWCPPSFDGICTSSDSKNKDGIDELHKSIYNLIEKHCDCPEILELARSCHHQTSIPS